MNQSSIEFLHQQAILALNNNELETAHRYLVQMIQKQSNHADAYFLLAMVNVKVGQIAKAIKLIEKALTPEKVRIRRKPTKGMKAKRLNNKRMHSEKKANRKKVNLFIRD